MTDTKFNWCDYYKLASSYSNENDEAKLRTAISRFYNASFCLSRDFILNNKMFLNKKNKKIMQSTSSKVHQETRKTFKLHPNLNHRKKGEKIAIVLNDLREYRNNADYDDTNPKNLKFAFNFCKSKSKLIFKLLDELN